MRAFKNEHQCESITQRWEAVDAYLECVTSCGLYDGDCVTRCITKHLEPGNTCDETGGKPFEWSQKTTITSIQDVFPCMR